ncbi:MAG: recombinase family protein [Bacillota bacterium]|nr:recombinase family protein [Bacillota bacterium]
MNASIEMRFKRGVFLTPVLLGYDQDDDGNLIINEEEAKTVRLIFFMYLYGYTCQQIANTLTSLERKTKIGNTEWSPGSVLEILKNERHCGDILARKTWTPNYLDHKSKKNNQDRNQYRQRDHHEAIVSRDDFIAVQRLIHNARYKSRSILPELHVITAGALTGYIAVNTIWAGFTRESYMHAYEQIEFPAEEPEPDVFEVHSGDFDLRGYQIAKGQFFTGSGSINVTFGERYMKFSTEAVRRFDTPYVEILVEPRKKLLAVRPSDKHRKYARKWYVPTEKGPCPRYISGTAFLPALYEIFGWDRRFKYRMLGTFQEKESERVLVFSLADSEAFNDFVFVNVYGQPIHPDAVSTWLVRLEKKYDLPHLNTHAFRHSVASALIYAGVDPVSVSRRLGHAQVSTTTNVYAHVFKKADERNAEILESLF